MMLVALLLSSRAMRWIRPHESILTVLISLVVVLALLQSGRLD